PDGLGGGGGGRAKGGQVALDDVQVSAAHAAGDHANQDLVWARRRCGAGVAAERRALDRRRAGQGHRSHRVPRYSTPARARSFFARLRCGASTIWPLKVDAKMPLRALTSESAISSRDSSTSSFVRE